MAMILGNYTEGRWLAPRKGATFDHFTEGAFLFTGTGIVPPNDFTLNEGDLVAITVEGVGTLENTVAVNT